MSRKITFCTRLWKEIFINEDGAVYSCCHEKPEAFGNIYDGPLREIINNEHIQKLRQDSLDGKLSCYKHCNLLSDAEKADPIPDSTLTQYEDLSRLKVLFGEACNIDCIMCWQDSKRRFSLDANALLNSVDLSPFKIIDIQGGEPLFIKDARIFFETATQQGKKVNLLTNGTIMDVETARRIAVSSTFINFSLNAATPATHEIVNKGSNWQKVMENITVVKNARDELKSPLIIHGHFTIIPENCAEIAKFIEMFPEFNFDTIDFGYDYKFPYYLKIHPRLKKKLKTDVSHAFENSAQKAKINTLRLRHLGFITTSNLEETISVE